MTTDLNTFVTLVRNYVGLIEASVAASPSDLSVPALIGHLGRVAGVAAELRDAEDFDGPDPPSHEHSEYLECHKALNERLPFTYYWICLDPTDLTAGSGFGTGDLSDDLADIYFDLRDGLQLFDAGFPEDALFTWKLSFWSHWSAHAADALAALVDYQQRV